jgi:transposase
VKCQQDQNDKDAPAFQTLLHSKDQIILSQAERIEELENQLEWLKRQVFGRKSERMVLPGQADFFADKDTRELEQLPEERETVSYERRRPKRTPLPKSLPRERIEIDVPAEQKVCPCCAGERHRIGQETSEELAFQPAKFWVREYVRFKYACARCEEGGVVTAPVALRPIPKSIFGPEVLAQLLVNKYEDHIPLHRQLKIARRHGIELSESTVNDAVLRSGELLSPLAELLKVHVLSGERIFTDDTPVRLKGNRPGEICQSRLWVYVRQREPGPPATAFDFTPDRSGNGPQTFLQGFEGYLQADAYGGYDALYARRCVVEVGCWAHARRYFEKAAKLHKKSRRAHVALGVIRKLFLIERELKECSEEKRFRTRRREALPVLREFKRWLDNQIIEVSTKSVFGEAVTYTLNQWDALVEYVNHGMLEMSNAVAENALRPVAVGRSNWLFFGAERGGRVAAAVMGLIATCKQNAVNPWQWLAHVLEQIRKTDDSDLQSLLPFHFKQTFPL